MTWIIWALVIYKLYSYWEIHTRPLELKAYRHEMIKLLNAGEVHPDIIEQMGYHYEFLQRNYGIRFNIELTNDCYRNIYEQEIQCQ